MPRVRTSRKKPPEGFDLIEPTLLALDKKMRDAESASHEGKRRNEGSHSIFRIHHQRSRYLYELFYRRKQISRELYEWCLREGYGDAALIAKWKKAGYERLCCLRCISTAEHSFGTVCICRVPRSKREDDTVIECNHCGCRGCASGD